jgi:hypothetical protein
MATAQTTSTCSCSTLGEAPAETDAARGSIEEIGPHSADEEVVALVETDMHLVPRGSAAPSKHVGIAVRGRQIC